MNTVTISPDQARAIAIYHQKFYGSNKTGKAGTEEIINDLGYIQIDTISVICRAHHHTLWNRNQDYHPDHLDTLQRVDSKIFDYWGHAASFLPIADYRFYLPLMKNFKNPTTSWNRNRHKKYGHLMAPVLERITKEGPHSSRSLSTSFKKTLPSGHRSELTGDCRGDWWEWKPTKVALELLFLQGDLMVARRDNFQRVYDITERVLPESVNTKIPSDNELGRFFVTKALKAHGIMQKKELLKHLPCVSKLVREQALIVMKEEKKIIEVTITGT